MPFPKVTFTKGATGSYPVQKNGSAFMIQTLASGGPLASIAEDTTILDTDINITIPVGYVGLILAKSSVITGSVDAAVVPSIIIGTGSAINLNVTVADIASTGENLTNGNDLAWFVLLKASEMEYTLTGF